MNNVSFNTSSKNRYVIGFALIASTAFSHPLHNDEHMESGPYYYENLAQSGSLTKVSILPKEAECNITEEIESERLSLGECPAFIKNTFGFNVTDFSRMLAISRPTAYKYLDGDIPDSSSETIERLYSLAQLWQSKVGDLKLGMEFKRPYDGRSLYELLLDGNYDLSKIQIEKIAKVVNSRKERANKSLNRGANQHNPEIIRHSLS